MNFIYLLFLVTPFGAPSEGYNILGLFHFHGKSHYVMFESLMLALAEKGHTVDVVTHYPPKNPPPNFNLISLAGTMPNMVGNISVDTFHSMTSIDMIKFITDTGGKVVCEKAFNHQAVKQLKNTKKKYDLVITELFGTDCMLGFGHYFKVPTIMLTSSVTLPWASARIGLPDHPGYIPNYFMYCADRMTLLERVENTFKNILYKFLFFYYGSSENNRAAKEFFGADLPDLEELALNTSMIMVNSHLSINYARPTVPNFVEVGGLHIRPPKPLPKHFEELVKTDASSKGVILLTMGSLIMTESFPVAKLQGMFDAFGELPYRVIWRADKNRFPKELNIPKNIFFEKWLPQMDLLCHPNTKMFVSHGGLMGTQEAIYCGVPRLGIPLFADQENNIRSSEVMGIGIKVDYNDISYETISSAAKKLLGDPSYSEKARKTAELFKDRPMSALETAIYWVEYVIRHRGAPHLRTAGADLAWYQYYLLDVGLILLSIILIPIYLLLIVFKAVSSAKKTKPKRD